MAKVKNLPKITNDYNTHKTNYCCSENPHILTFRWSLPSARMRSEGSVVGSVCVSMLQLTPRLFVRPANDTIYFTGNDNQFNLAVFF